MAALEADHPVSYSAQNLHLSTKKPACNGVALQAGETGFLTEETGIPAAPDGFTILCLLLLHNRRDEPMHPLITRCVQCTGKFRRIAGADSQRREDLQPAAIAVLARVSKRRYCP